MPTRELSPPPTSLERPSRLHKKPPSAGNPLKRKDSSFNLRQRVPTPIDAPKRTLSPASSNTMNRGPTTAESSPKVLSSTPNGAGNTIRSVPNNDYRLEASPSRNGDRNMPISRGHSPIPTSHPPPSSLAQVAHPPPSSLAVRQQPISRSISTEFGTTRSYTNGNGNNGFPIAEDGSAQGGQWSSAVGRANLGKSGRVIERLMGENDMLKRDITIERLRAEESKQELKMAEARMEQQSSDYEAKLHEAAINKTLLKRRERQLADLKTQVDGEKANAQRALESEKYWRDEADRERWEAQIKVDNANNRSMMFEGRYNTVVDHWEDQGAVVEKAMGKMRRQIAEVNELRAEDARRMNMMEALSNQQAKELDGLRGEKDAIATQFEAYKAEQERLLKDIKESAKSREMEQEKQIEEAKRLVGELKWAINVQKNVRNTH